jgi:GNAT superfamily N-acetyltransferase
VTVGTLSFHIQPDHIRFGEFYLLPQHQNRGIGSALLAHCRRVADSLTLPVRLEYLHWNPVGALYRRHDFVQVGQSDTHRFLQRAAKPPAKA